MANTTAPKNGERRMEVGYTESNGGAGSSGFSEFVLRGTTTDATPTVLYINNDSTNGKLTIPSGESWNFVARVVGRQDDGHSGGYGVITGLLENVGGTTAIVGSNVADTPMEDTAGWACTATADNTNDALLITVTGASSANVNWTAYVSVVRSYNVA